MSGSALDRKKRLSLRESFFGKQNDSKDTLSTHSAGEPKAHKEISSPTSRSGSGNKFTGSNDGNSSELTRGSSQLGTTTSSPNNTVTSGSGGGSVLKRPGVSHNKIKSGSGGPEVGSWVIRELSPALVPAFEAVNNKDLRVLENVLANQEVDLNEMREGRTLLHEACLTGSLDAVKLVLGNKKLTYIGPIQTIPLINVRSTVDGKTAIHICCEKGYVNIFKYLLLFSPNIYTPDDLGKTPLQYCLDNFEIFYAFFEAGMKLNPKEEESMFQSCLDQDSVKVAHLIRYVSKTKELVTKNVDEFVQTCIKRCMKEQWDRLYLSKSKIEVFPVEIVNCTNLLALVLSKNSLTSLPPQLGSLAKLEKLDVSNNLLQEIPPCLAEMKNLKDIDLRYNLLKYPETEIVARGPIFIRNYLSDMAKMGGGAVPCHEIKLMFVGQENVGKTSLLRTLKGEKYTMNISTDGINIELFGMDKKKGKEKPTTKFRAWDFAGQELYYSTHQFFLSANAIYLLVWDLRKDPSESRIEYWLQSIKARADNAPVILVGTHLDDKSLNPKKAAETLRKVEEQYKIKHQNIKSSFAVSCLDGRGIKQLRVELELVATDKLIKIPKAYRTLEDALYAVRDRRLLEHKGNTVISWNELVEEANSSGIGEDDAFLKRAACFLHDLGSIVYFDDPKLKDLVVLDPTWLTKCMATIITTKHSYARKGFLYQRDFEHIWKSDEFPIGMANQILHLLQLFEIIQPLHDSDPPMSLVPWLLPNERPDFRLLWLPWDNSQKQLDREYRFSFIPSGLMSRLMVRLMQLGESQLYWRHGIIFQLKKSDFTGRGLIEMIPNTDTMRVSVRAHTFDEVALMLRHVTSIIEQLVNDWFRIDSHSSVPCPQCLKHQEGSDLQVHCFSLEDCEKAALDGRLFLQCEKHGVSVRLDRLTPDITMDDFKGVKFDKKELTFGKRIGKGGFGSVFLGNWRDEEVAIKEILIPEDKGSISQLFSDFRHECWVWSHLKHPNIVELKGFCMSPFLMAMEIVPAGDLYGFLHDDFVKVAEFIIENLEFLVANVSNKTWLEKRKEEFTKEMYEKLDELEVEYKKGNQNADEKLLKKFREFTCTFFNEIIKKGGLSDNSNEELDDIRSQVDRLLVASMDWGFRLRVALDVALGMSFLHGIQPPLLHRDLKSPNILLKSRDINSPVLGKVADFGLASGLYLQSLRAQQSTHCVGNPTWVAPEILGNKEYSEASDVYAFGIITWELFTRRHPFRDVSKINLDMIEDAIKNGRRPQYPKFAPASYVKLSEDCWSPQPEKRTVFRNIVDTISLSLLPTLAPNCQLPDTVKASLKEAQDQQKVAQQAGGDTRIQAVDGQILLKLKIGENDETKCYCLAQATNLVLGGCNEGRIYLWNAENGYFLGQTGSMFSHTSTVNDIVYERKFGTIWSGSDDRTIRVWCMSPKLDQFLESKTTRSGYLYYLSGTKGLLKSKDWKKRYFHLDKKESKLIISKEKDKSALETVMIDHGSCYTQLGTESKKSSIFKLSVSKGVYTLSGENDEDVNGWVKAFNSILEIDQILILQKEIQVGKRISCLLVCDNYIWTSSTSDRVVRIYDIQTHLLVKEIDTSALAPDQSGTIFRMLTIDNLVWIAVGSSLLRVNAKTFEPISDHHKATNSDKKEDKLINGIIALPANLCFSKKSQIWTCKNDNCIEIWDAETGNPVTVLKSEDPSEKLFCLLLVGDTVWSVDREGAKFSVWSIATGRRIRTMDTAHKDAISSMLLVWDRTVWSASWDSYIHIWK